MSDDLERKRLEIEARKTEIEQAKLENECSFARRWFPTVATLTIGLATVGFNVQQAFVAYQQRMVADQRAQAAEKEARERQDAQWGIGVLELYVKYPDQFDASRTPATAGKSLKALALVAPSVMRPILENKQDDLVRAAASATDDGARSAADTALRAINEAVQQAVVAARAGQPQAVSVAATPWPAGVKPADYTIYIQYGSGSKERAAALADYLRTSGFRVPAAELVTSAPAVGDVRYYKQDQASLADELAQRVSPAIGSIARPKFIGGQRNLPDGILEIWLPSGSV